MEHLADNSQSHSDLAGLKIGDYRLLRRLGSGGMADVYLAVQESLKRNVALKILKKHLANDEGYVDRFKREAQAAAGLVHANIVQIFEVGQANGFHFIAQEYVRGRNLKQYLGRYGAVPPDMALSVLRQSAMALQKGDEHDVVHRDIKPENILLTSNGEIKIADFGLARVGDEADNTLTRAGITVGTPLYMSPEQIEGAEVDIRSDIYSLGVTLYHMLVGQPPFDGDSPLVIAVKHTSETPGLISDHRSDLPGELDTIVNAMLSKKKEDRPQSPMQLMKMLQAINVEASNGFDWKLFEVQMHSRELVAGIPMLHEVAQTESFVRPKKGRRTYSPLWLVVPAMILLSLVAWWGGSQIADQYSGLKNLRNDDLEVAEELEVPMECDVEEQYLSAYWNSREIPADDFERRKLLWKAVGEYFPPNAATTDVHKTELYNLRAKCRLGELYIESGDLDRASEIYDELASQDEMSLEFRTTGYAGKAITLSMRPVDSFRNGGIQEQESMIRLCLDDEGHVRENKDLLNQFLKERILVLLERIKSYGKYTPPPRPTDFAKSRKVRSANWFGI
ncbi:serine/threonine-protein kinase [Mariniblastus fucicola]|nr:serine/threonine-protein kinase [Mariniblastus fucicola]